MIYLALAVGCSLAIGMLLKYAAQHQIHRVALLTANYAMAFALGAVLYGAGGGGLGVGELAQVGVFLGMGSLTGALFILGFFLFALATQHAGMALSMGVMRIAVLLPVLASWLIWGEVPTPGQAAGLALAGVAFFLIARPTRSQRTLRQQPPTQAGGGAAEATEATERTLGRFGVLALLFVVAGMIDIAIKTYDEVFADTYPRAAFLVLVFGMAFLIGIVLVLREGRRTGQWPGRQAIGWGLVLGVLNYASNEFFLEAVDRLSGPFVFPANHIAIVLGGALLGVSVWGERLDRVNWAGVALAAVALLLLGA